MPLEQPLPQAEKEQAASGQLRLPHCVASAGLSKQRGGRDVLLAPRPAAVITPTGSRTPAL